MNTEPGVSADIYTVKTVTQFGNHKPWVTSEVKAALNNRKKGAFKNKSPRGDEEGTEGAERLHDSAQALLQEEAREKAAGH